MLPVLLKLHLDPASRANAHNNSLAPSECLVSQMFTAVRGGKKKLPRWSCLHLAIMWVLPPQTLLRWMMKA